jgi:tRNA pseudouridine38-40 synthase
VEVKVTANAFLRRMVRSLVAVLLEVGRGGIAPDAVDELLAAGERALHGRAAPARGLTLERVVYESKSHAGAGGAGAGTRNADRRTTRP